MKFRILRDKFKLKSSKVCILYLNIGLGILRAKLKGPWDFEIEIELAPQYLVLNTLHGYTVANLCYKDPVACRIKQ